MAANIFLALAARFAVIFLFPVLVAAAAVYGAWIFWGTLGGVFAVAFVWASRRDRRAVHANNGWYQRVPED